MSTTKIEYAFRSPSTGTVISGDYDAELYVGIQDGEGSLRSYVPAIDPSPEDVRRIHARAKRDGFEVLTREAVEVLKVETGDWAAVTPPLPTTVGSVIEYQGLRYALSTFGMRDANWIRLPGGGKTFYSPADLAGATVLFDAAEVTA